VVGFKLPGEGAVPPIELVEDLEVVLWT